MVRRGVWLVVVSVLLAVAVAGKAAAQSDDLAELNRQLEELSGAGRYAEAIVVAQRALALAESLLGPDHLDVGTAHNRLAVLYLQQGRYAEAEPAYRRVLAIKEKGLGPDHSDVGTALYGLGVLYVQQGRYAEAEPLYKRALTIKEKALGPDHSDVGSALFGLAGLYVYLGRLEDAEPLYRRALAVKEKALGPDHSQVGSILHNLAVLLAVQRRYQEAELLYQRVLAIKEAALGPEHTEVGSTLYALAELYANLGRYGEAEPLYRRVLSIKENALGPEHTEVATTLFGLAGLYANEGRAAEAEQLYKRVLDIKLKAVGPDHPEMGIVLNELASINFRQGRWATAADYGRQSTQVVIRRAKRGTEPGGQSLTGKAASEAQRARDQFEGLVKASHRLALQEAARASELAREMFVMAQWSQSSQAAASLAQMAARQAKGDGALAGLVRQRQDLVEEWQARDKVLISARAQPPDRRDAQGEAVQSARLAEIDGLLAGIDKTLAKDFPEYASLADAQPLTIEEVQALLRADEALLLLFDTQQLQPAPEETFIWVVTRTQARWLKSGLGTRALADHVAALRCGLDETAWDGESEKIRCIGLLESAGGQVAAAGTPLPFDLGRAHALYTALFGQTEDLIKGKHLLIAAQGPLTALPFQVLVTQKPAQAIPANVAGYAKAAWLAKRNAVTVLPSVASLTALRRFAKASKATGPFIGFGNPLLVGPNGTDRRAWERQACAPTMPPAMRTARRSARNSLPALFRSGFADLEEVRRQYPLPETANELCAVAQSTGADGSAVYLGARASETTVKALSANGRLATARVVHFATHGLLAGETEMLANAKAEPALLLTPPDRASDEDDGLLTASEIAQLKLDADWVVLSACNTAAGESDKPGTEALSGLARAFFYSGARALLVSHWAVDSQAAVKLVTKAFDQLKANAKIGRAEALRRSMLALIAAGGADAHPATWAPFVVVGEGAR